MFYVRDPQIVKSTAPFRHCGHYLSYATVPRRRTVILQKLVHACYYAKSHFHLHQHTVREIRQRVRSKVILELLSMTHQELFDAVNFQTHLQVYSGNRRFHEQ